jgi:predicted kinase
MIKGNETSIAKLKSSQNKFIILFGPRGTGKYTVAKEYAMGLSALDDLFIITSENTITVDDVLPIIKTNYTPASKEYRTFIIDDAEKLNVTAQNKLLKTLEELKYNRVILVVDSNESGNLSDTIYSRGEVIRFTPLTKDEKEEFLKDKTGLEKIIDSTLFNSPGRYLGFKNSKYYKPYSKMVAALFNSENNFLEVADEIGIFKEKDLNSIAKDIEACKMFLFGLLNILIMVELNKTHEISISRDALQELIQSITSLLDSKHVEDIEILLVLEKLYKEVKSNGTLQ